jgi:hypothetical protein
MKGINWAGVIAALVVGQLLGFLWYGMIFEEQWMALSSAAGADSSSTAMAYGAVNQLVVAIGLGLLVAKLGADSLIGGARTGLMAGFFFAATATAQNFIYGGADPGLIPIDIGFLLVAYTAMGAVVGGVTLPVRTAAAA